MRLKDRRAYGPSASDAFTGSSGLSHNHFGLIVVSCDGADIRPMPDAIVIYADDRRQVEVVKPSAVPRADVAEELYAAAVLGRPPLHTGEWGLATLEICLAILRSAETAREIRLEHQI
jgi:phthalate 4,5-cis-dihydrodiol dehydrogenase